MEEAVVFYVSKYLLETNVISFSRIHVERVNKWCWITDASWLLLCTVYRVISDGNEAKLNLKRSSDLARKSNPVTASCTEWPPWNLPANGILLSSVCVCVCVYVYVRVPNTQLSTLDCYQSCIKTFVAQHICSLFPFCLVSTQTNKPIEHNIADDCQE